jgi:hypothetical protein
MSCQKINSKPTFRKACLELLPQIRKYKIPDFKDKSDKCAVFIDCRILPHYEYIFRQVATCLDDTWSMHIFTGSKNYEYMRELCSSIGNIKVTNLGMINMVIDEYSTLLLSKEFWEKIDGEKVLIFQEDSILFRKGIDKFLEYDYVGSPWPKECNNSANSIGNGGLSLRSKKKTLELLNAIKLSDIHISTSTQQYMRNANLNVIPEDVYYSNGMILIGANLPTYEIALTFAIECVYVKNSLGGHQFWMSSRTHNFMDDMKKHLIYLEINGFNQHGK